MLDTKYNSPKGEAREDDFKLALPIDHNWKSFKNRMLVVLESVDSHDLKAGQLLANRSRQVLVNTLTYARKQALKMGEKIEPFAYAAVNFNQAKTFHLKTEAELSGHHVRFANRVGDVIEKLQPTHLLVCGDGAMRHLFPDIKQSQWKRGWVHRLKYGDHRLKVTSTLDLEPLYVVKQNDSLDDDDEEGGDERDLYGKANLLGYVSRHMTNLLLGRHAFSLKDLTPNPVYVNTLSKFDKLYARLCEEPWVAIDTETKNLSVNHNQIFTIQFAFEEDRGYVLPLFHPKTPFSLDDLTYISKKLRAWFKAEPESHFKGMLYMNGKFDLRVVRAQFGLPIILRPLWEVTAGEHNLDENLKFLAKNFGTPAGNLRAILTSYDNDKYWTLPFSKEERATIAFVNPSDPDFLDYASLDVQCLLGIKRQQIARSRLLDFNGQPYTKWFRRIVMGQMSNTVHVLSHMEARGVHLDRYHLVRLKSKDSPLLKTLNEVRAELFATPAARKANRLILEQTPTLAAKGGLFSQNDRWVLDLNKPDHRIALFFDSMGLEPLTYTKTKLPQVNKNFQKSYGDDYREVKLFAQWQETYKLWGTYIKGWYLRLSDSPDGKDDRLRPSYGFFDVVTGRLNSFDPSLHQVPTRGPQSKAVKRAFVAPRGSLHFKYDYSAHEVRFWGIVAKDPVIADTFRVGQKLRKMFRTKPTPELAAKIKKQGDVHIINIYHFYKKWVEKSDPLRDAIKAVVFGTIYQMSVKSLSKSLSKQRLSELDALRRKLKAQLASDDPKLDRKVIEGEYRKVKEDIQEAENRDWLHFAEDLVAKLFNRFKRGAEWLEWAKKFAEKNLYVFAPTGRRRNLYGVLTGLDGLIAALLRRAVNSPVQGIASDVTTTAARLTAVHFYRYLVKFGFVDQKMLVLPAEPLKLVHDATYAEAVYEHYLPYLYISQWVATYGVTEYYRDVFELEFNIEPEIEIEIGASEDKHYKWDWTDKNLEEILKKSLSDQVELGFLEKGGEAAAYAKIMRPMKDKAIRRYLETRYPILGVTV